VAVSICIFGHVWCHMSSWAIGIQYIFGSIGTHLNDDCEEKIWDRFDSFLLSFSFLDSKVRK
jgi:hypothetical protein